MLCIGELPDVASTMMVCGVAFTETHVAAQPIPEYGGLTDVDDDGSGDPCSLKFLDRDGGIWPFEMAARAVIQKDDRLGLGDG